MITDQVAYAAQSLAWSLVGVPVGFVLGLHVAWECRKRGVQVPMTRRVGRVGYALLVVIVAALAITSQVQQYQNGQANKANTDANKAITNCLRAYSKGFADAIDASRSAAADVATTQDGLWQTIADGLKAPSPEVRAQFERQLDDYLKARAAAKATQAANPIRAPRDICPE